MKVGNFEKFKNKENLTNIYNIINEMNLWEEFKILKGEGMYTIEDKDKYYDMKYNEFVSKFPEYNFKM